MRITSILVAIILCIGVASAFKATTTYYTDDQCKQIATNMATEVVEYKSGKCEAAPFGETGTAKFKVKGDKIEACIFGSDDCSGTSFCSSFDVSGQCEEADEVGYWSKTAIYGSASSVAFSGLFVVVAAAFALAF